MTIIESVEAGIRNAMKNKDQEKLSALRMIKADFLLKEKESGKSVDDPVADRVLQGMFRKYTKAKEEYESLGKHDEAERYERDMKLIESFMSTPMMNEDQGRQSLQDLGGELNGGGPEDFGRVMKAFMSAHPNAEGKVVSSLLKEILNK
jgi:uncharacterized protein YqeY